MTRALTLALPAVLALTFAVGAVAPPAAKPSKPGATAPAKAAPRLMARGEPAADQLDFIFYASDRPVLIRLHLNIGDKPYSAAWDVWMDKMFAWFDKDKNGTLNAAEVARLVQASFLQNQVNGSIGGSNGPPVALATLDTNKDGKVTKEEFRAYYRNSGFNALRFYNQTFQAQTAKQINNAIYRQLGLKPDGQLKQEDAARLTSLMPKLDENEDELLTSTELNNEANNAYTGFAVAPSGRMVRPQPTPETGLVQIQPKAPVANLVRQLLLHYDKNKDGKLTPGELDKKFFAELDMDSDGKLDAEELKAFFRRPPDLVFRARVGPMGGASSVLRAVSRFTVKVPFRQTPRAEVLNPTQPLGKKVRKVNDDNLAFDLGDARFALQASQGYSNMNGRFNGVKQFYLNEFDGIVDKKKGYVEKKQQKANMQRPYLFMIFTQADKNGDDKLTKKELTEWLDLVSEGSNCFVTLQVNDLGRSLFELIDSNSDNQLSVRELRTAWQRIKPLCKADKGLTQPDLPRTLRISMGLGNTFFAQPVPVAFGGPMMPPGQPLIRGVPAWFSKMDLNRDGDISPKEWLGTDEEFKAIDTDGDGLISADEARQFEARRKKKSDPTQKTAPGK